MKISLKAFTLVEIMMVITIAGIMLAMTFNLGWDYINFLRYKQDREHLINLMDTAIITSRTTNYYNDVKYTYLDITLTQTSLDISYGSGDATAVSSCTSTTNEGDFATYTLDKALLTGFTAPITMRVVPFQVACYSELQSNDICSSLTGLDMTVQSTITDDETCYTFDLSVCKFAQVVCP